MFKVSDFRQTGMPTLGTAMTAEGAWTLAEHLGIREHAFVEPVVGSISNPWLTDLEEVDAVRVATHVGELALSCEAPAMQRAA